MRGISRRAFIRSSVGATLAAAGLAGCRTPDRSTATRPTGEWVNDVHSRLNRTHVAGVARPTTLDDLTRLIETAHRRRESVSLCGGRHAGGGQQFRTDRRLVA